LGYRYGGWAGMPNRQLETFRLNYSKKYKLVNSKVRTLETRIIPNKKASEEANLLNGAGDGIVLLTRV